MSAYPYTAPVEPPPAPLCLYCWPILTEGPHTHASGLLCCLACQSATGKPNAPTFLARRA